MVNRPKQRLAHEGIVVVLHRGERLGRRLARWRPYLLDQDSTKHFPRVGRQFLSLDEPLGGHDTCRPPDHGGRFLVSIGGGEGQQGIGKNIVLLDELAQGKQGPEIIL